MGKDHRGKRKTPQEKKEFSYEKDSVRIAEYPHALRKSARLAQTYSLLLDLDSVRELSEIEAEEMTKVSRELLTSRCLWLRSFLEDEPRWEDLLQELDL